AVGTGHFVARSSGVLAGTAVATEVFAQLDPAVTITWAVADSDGISAGQRLGMVHGSLRSVLAGERSALNFLGHLSGIATLTRAPTSPPPGPAPPPPPAPTPPPTWNRTPSCPSPPTAPTPRPGPPSPPPGTGRTRKATSPPTGGS